MMAVYKREIRMFLTTPLGYVIAGLLFVYLGIIFANNYGGGVASVSNVFALCSIALFILIPFMTMRSFSEEKRLKTDQLLLTSSVKIKGIVLGKFFAVLTVIYVILCEFFIFNIIMSSYGKVDWVIFFGTYIGLLLLVAALVSIGIFISSLTESQMIAALLTLLLFVILLFFEAMPVLLGFSFLSKYADFIGFNSRYQTFTKGIIDYSNIVYFVSVCALFNFLTVRVIDKKRWA